MDGPKRLTAGPAASQMGHGVSSIDGGRADSIKVGLKDRAGLRTPCEINYLTLRGR